MIKITALVIIWFFIITGAIQITPLTFWLMKQSDTTSIFLGVSLFATMWSVIVYELIQSIKKINK